jgi:hypothetical protein
MRYIETSKYGIFENFSQKISESEILINQYPFYQVHLMEYQENMNLSLPKRSYCKKMPTNFSTFHCQQYFLNTVEFTETKMNSLDGKLKFLCWSSFSTG